MEATESKIRLNLLYEVNSLRLGGHHMSPLQIHTKTLNSNAFKSLKTYFNIFSKIKKEQEMNKKTQYL